MVFESSVILEGSKTLTNEITKAQQFESSVILEGSKTMALNIKGLKSLRVVLF